MTVDISTQKILIIDDETTIRQSFADHLEDLGYQVLTAKNGRLGVEIMEREKPDLTLTDLRMPEMSGLEVIKKGIKISPDTPIIVVSGAGRIGDAIQALRLGAWDYILKPIDDMSVLEHQVVKALEKKHLIQENKMYQENLERMVQARTAELKQAKERTEKILKSIQSGVLVIDAKTHQVIEVNPAAAEMIEAKQEEIIGHKCYEFICPTEDRQNTPPKMPRQINNTECILITKDGKQKNIIKNVVAATLDQRECLLESFIDITKRKEASEQIRLQLSRFDSLHTIDTEILTSKNLKNILDVILKQVQKELSIDAADILLFEPSLQSLRCISSVGFTSEAMSYTLLRLGKGAAGQAALQQKTIYIENLQKTPDLFTQISELLKENIVSYFGVPLLVQGKIKGVLEIYHRKKIASNIEWLKFLDMLAGQAAIAIDNVSLFEVLQKSNLELRLAYDTTLEGWAHALELRDMKTEGHSRRVIKLTTELATRMGVDPRLMDHIRRGALLHDIGKMGIPDAILNKPGPLTDQEWGVMKQHPIYAYEMLKEIIFLKPALDIPYSHHEKWDGSGYPLGMHGEAIPWAARIFAIVDVYDALSTDRTYRKAWTKERAINYIKEQSNIHFDPKVVDVFLEIIQNDETL